MSSRFATLRLLREADFRALVGAQVLNQAGDGMAQAVFTDTLILEPLTESTPERIFYLFVVTLVPYSLISPFLGVFVDRWPRRAVLIGTNLARAVLMTGLVMAQATTHASPLLFAAVLTVLGMGRLFSTTKGAVLPIVVHDARLLRANSLSGAAGMIAALAGGIAGVAALTQVGPPVALSLTAVVYLAGAVAARLISSPLTHGAVPDLRTAVARVTGDLRAGLREIWRRPAARLPLTAMFFMRTATIIVAVAAILVIKTEFTTVAERGGRLSASALALAAAGVGAFAGAVTVPLIGRRLRPPGLIVVGFAVTGGGMALLGGISSLWAVIVLSFLAGYGGFAAKVATDVSVQNALPDNFRGRAFATYDILYNLASVAAGAIVLALGGLPLRNILLLCSVGTMAIGATMGVLLRRAHLAYPDAVAS